MMKFLLILALGVGVGYVVGFKDAQTHEETIVARTLDRVGGSARGQYNADVDGTMEKLNRR
jgi:hypothetical protein